MYIIKVHLSKTVPARNRRLLAFLLAKAPKGTKSTLSARFTVRPVAGSKAKRDELASAMLRQASRFTPFSPDGCPAHKAYGARLAHNKYIAFVVLVMRQLDGLSG
ncbi:MAG: hypothetical protein LBL79_12340 [Prevotella sp.]|jgi:hypothetical protein|nr:hypothetical protein [Prevotella sp.]